MDNIKIYKKLGSKPANVFMMSVDGEKKCWEYQDSYGPRSKRKRICFELGPETLNIVNELELIEEGNIKVDYSGKKKIEFTTSGVKNLSGDFVFYIPSWGLHTGKKIWVLIPSAKK